LNCAALLAATPDVAVAELVKDRRQVRRSSVAPPVQLSNRLDCMHAPVVAWHARRRASRACAHGMLGRERYS